MAASVRLALLGTFEVQVDGATIGSGDFERRSGAELIQLLALATGRRLHREQVMDALWPEAEPSSAANSLRKAATYARRATGATDAIVARDQIVALFPDREVELDVDVVETARADDEASVIAATEAYQGDLLPEQPYAEWVVRNRDRLRQHMIELLREANRWNDLIRLDPASEEAAVALMDQALADGDRQAALRRYRELEARLRDELSVTPGAAAMVLRDRALDLDSALDAPKAGTRTFLAADLEGSTSTLLDRVIDVAQSGGGVVFDHPGAGLWAAFPSASEAVAAAVAIQHDVHTVSEEPRRPRARIGLDVGEAEHRTGHWTGPVVDRTAGILATANGDQIICSELVAGLAAPGLHRNVTTVDLGLFRLPGLAPTVLHRVDVQGIECRTGLRASRLSGRPLGPARELTIGRDEETSEVRELLGTERLVTIVGPGGAGKTHLARHAAASIIDDVPGGVWMCQFAALTDANAVGQELLSAIGAVQHAEATVIESIVRSLGDRRSLIVLDNCEHLLEPIASLSREILDQCSGLTLLATSREPLGLPAERQYPLGELSRAAAIELFVTMARRQGTTIDPADAATARICDRLDDLPLAIQLAAARTRTFDPATIESLLDDRFAHLTSSQADGPDHHQTLGTAIAWSVDALDAELQQVLCDLSVLTGRFTIDEAAAIAGQTGSTAADIIEQLDLLVRRSLVVGPERVGGETGYRLLESVRLFAPDRGDRDRAEDRHLIYFRDAAEQNRRRLQHDSLPAFRWFRSRWRDLRQAQAHAVTNRRLDDLCRIVTASSHYCGMAMQLEVVEWCEVGLGPGPSSIGGRHVETLANWAWLSIHRGRIDEARALVGQVTEAEPDHPEILRAKALICWSRGDLAGALDQTDQILERDDIEPSLEVGMLMFKAILLAGTGHDVASIAHRVRTLSTERGPVFEAHALFVDAVAVARTDPYTASDLLDDCQYLTDRHDLVDIGAAVRLVRGWVTPSIADNPLAVLQVAGASLAWLRERGLWSLAFVQLGISALAFAEVERVELAVTLLSACEASGFTTNFRAELTDTLLQGARGTHPDRFDDWWAAGQRLDGSAACALALSNVEQLRRSS